MASQKVYLGRSAYLAISNTEIVDASDVTLELDKTMINTNCRRTGGWNSESPGFKKLGITFKMLVREANTITNTLIDAFIDDTVVNAVCRDKAAGEGLAGDFYVTKATRSEPVEGAVTLDVALSWTSDDGESAPTWMTTGATGGSYTLMFNGSATPFFPLSLVSK